MMNYHSTDFFNYLKMTSFPPNMGVLCIQIAINRTEAMYSFAFLLQVLATVENIFRYNYLNRALSQI